MDSIRIRLGDKSFDARPTFPAIEKIEAITGRELTAMIADPTAISITDLATLIHTPIAVTGDSVTREEIGERIIECGIAAALTEGIKILNAVLEAGPKEAPPVGDTKSGPS